MIPLCEIGVEYSLIGILKNNPYDLGPSLPYKLRGAKMITSPTGKGVVLIGGYCSYDDYTEGKYNDFLELSGDSEKNLQWSLMTQKLQYPRSGHVAFTIPNAVYDGIVQRQRQKIKEDRETIEANARKQRKLV